ncbi:MAG: hypothetical protein LBU32_26440 [Clostridiales bacterium]|nr:hypothetical protein [Clostridiales bacterium]
MELDCPLALILYRFSSNVPILEIDCPLSGAIDIGMLHSLFNQAPKKVILYEKQYIKCVNSALSRCDCYRHFALAVLQTPKQELSYANHYSFRGKKEA